MSTELHKRLAPPSTSFGAIIKLAAPILVSNLAIVGGGTIDTLMAGHLGANDLAAVAIGIAVTTSVFIALVGVMQGLSPIAGHHFGAGRHGMVGFELHQTLWLALIMSLIGIPTLSYTPLWMSLSHAQGEVASIATQYLVINAIGLPGALGGRAFMAMNAAVSRPKIAMYISVAMLILKVPFNAIFMYGWGPIDAYGGAGCAISSSITGWLTLFSYYSIWRLDKFYDPMRQNKISWPQWKAIAGQLRLGIPIGLSAFFEVTSFTFMTIFISRLGATIVSGHQIVANLTSLFFMTPLSIGVASSVLVAQCLGANHPEGSRLATVRSLKLAVGIAACVCAILFFGKHFLIGLYTQDQQVTDVAISLIVFASFYHLFDSINAVGSFSLRGYRVTIVPMILYAVLLWGCGLGIGSWLTFTDNIFGYSLGARGYWSGITMGLTISGIIIGSMALWVARIKEQRLKTRLI